MQYYALTNWPEYYFFLNYNYLLACSLWVANISVFNRDNLCANQQPQQRSCKTWSDGVNSVVKTWPAGSEGP